MSGKIDKLDVMELLENEKDKVILVYSDKGERYTFYKKVVERELDARGIKYSYALTRGIFRGDVYEGSVCTILDLHQNLKEVLEYTYPCAGLGDNAIPMLLVCDKTRFEDVRKNNSVKYDSETGEYTVRGKKIFVYETDEELCNRIVEEYTKGKEKVGTETSKK